MIKVSLCITIHNENIDLSSLLKQFTSLQKGEIIIVNSSTNKALQRYIKKYVSITHIFINSTRSEARNIATEMAQNSIIVMTDAGCIPKANWLELITQPFINKNTDIVAGFYEMKANNKFEKAESAFLGVIPKEFNNRFMPSTRSVAFRKSIWEKVGGFPENLKDTAEDTIFFEKAIEAGARIVRVKDAIVYWEMPKTIREFAKKIYRYARGDAQSRSYWHPIKKWRTHNIKALSIILRYLIFISIILINWKLFFIIFSIYLLWSYLKVANKLEDYLSALWGIPLQIISDISVSIGFVVGILGF